ncbi:hypothetical protein BGZ90_010449 [Linnemannia elongata]|nr:hypothetical protein BGZ90_010449 [Linnemannia elongata]
MDNNSDNNKNNAPGTSLQHQQQGQQQLLQQPQPQPQPQNQRKTNNQKTSLRPLPTTYKIQLHLRKGEPLERRRLTHGLPDPDPYPHIRGQDSYIILRERIYARVARHPDLFWPEDGIPYIKPAESVPQKYYQQMTEDNFEEQMAKAWRMEAKRLGDEDLIVLNVFVYLKEREPKEPGPPGRPPGRVAAAVATAATTAASGSGAIAGGSSSTTVRPPGAPRGPRMRPRLADGTAGPRLNAGTEVAGTSGTVRPRPLMIPGGTVPGPGTGMGLLPPRPPRPGAGRPGRPPLPPHLRRRPPPPGSHAAGEVGPGGGPGPIRRGPGRPPGRPPFRPPPPGMQGPRVRPTAVDRAVRNRILTPGEAVVAAINSSVVPAAASSSSPSASTPVTGTVGTVAAGSSASSSASSSAPSAIPAIIPPNPTLVSVALPSSVTRTQAPRAASAYARQQHHRLTAIPQINPPPPPPAPIDQDHDMEDIDNKDNNFDDLMQDEFDQPGLEELPPQRTYDIHAPHSTSPPSAVAASTSSSASSSSAAGQAGDEDDGDFKLINIKINGLVVPIMFDIKSLREAIFS